MTVGELDGRIALVTGGGRGIGRAIALALAGTGAAVAVTGRDLARLDAVRAEIAAQGGRAIALRCDVTDSAEIEAAFGAARRALGPIDILINNAGITASVKFAEMDDATWERIMLVNATGPFRCCRAVVPAMIERRWGRIINVASYAALSGIPYSSAYSASKHALLGLTRALALELGRYGITANALCPGWVDTDMVRDAVDNIVAKTGRTPSETRASILALAGQPRMLAAEEVAAAALRLAGAAGAATNGQAITID
jgi:NAD(P)-dependent dehydrogenase (short-subunit alcohol dehydrogenase family)